MPRTERQLEASAVRREEAARRLARLASARGTALRERATTGDTCRAAGHAPGTCYDCRAARTARLHERFRQAEREGTRMLEAGVTFESADDLAMDRAIKRATLAVVQAMARVLSRMEP